MERVNEHAEEGAQIFPHLTPKQYGEYGHGYYGPVKKKTTIVKGAVHGFLNPKDKSDTEDERAPEL